MKFAIDLLIKNNWAEKPFKHRVYFDCKPEEIQERAKAWFESKESSKSSSLKGLNVISRTDGPTEFFPGTVLPTYKQFSICWI